MENPTVSGLRSRSRSKTPFLRSSCDRETCPEGEDHTHHKSGRKTPIKRSTPVKQLRRLSTKAAEPIREEEHETQAFRTRHSTRLSEKVVKTSDYSSGESLDRVSGRKEIVQNEINSQYERVSSSQRYPAFIDLTLSPIPGAVDAHNVTHDRSSRISSPTFSRYSGCSTDSSFAEQALADASVLLEKEPAAEHLPSRLYRMAGEYWNKYPKTDYTYSPLSKDRVELAPGQVAVPNMSRRSLAQFRVHGPVTSQDEVDRLHSIRKRFTAVDSSDDELYVRNNGGYRYVDDRWWLTRLLVTIVTTITTTTANVYRRVVGPSHRYPYTERRPVQASLASRAGAAAAAPFYWIYTAIKEVVTTTVTTITETVTPNHVGEREKYVSRSHQVQAAKRRRWWPWLLLLLLPIVGYGSHYTYENFDHLALPNFTDFQLNLSEFTAMELPTFYLPSMPNISLPEFPKLNLSLPDINITLPDISDNLPEVSKTYREYKDIVQNRVADASDYIKVVGESCYEELRRYWRGVLG